MNNPAAPLLLTSADRNTLTKWALSATAPHRVVTRATTLLMAGDGAANSRIATTLDISRPTALHWRACFLTDGLDSVGEVRPGRGLKPEITADQMQAIVHATLHETPPGATHWSCRSMAKAAGVSRSTVQRICDAHGLQPHRITTFKLSKDPAFVEKLTDVVGLYLNPPDKAVVLCVDEKSQIHALDRRELVQQADAATSSPRRLLQRAGTGSSHPGLLDPTQCRPEAVRVEHHRRGHPQQGQQV